MPMQPMPQGPMAPQGQPPQASPIPAQPSPPATATPAQNASGPNGQKIYDGIVVAGLNSIFGPKQFPIIIAKLAHSTDVVQEIGHSAAMIMSSIEETAKKAGKQVPQNVLFQACKEFVANLIQVAIGLRLIPNERAKEVMQSASKAAFGTYLKNKQAAGGIPLPKPATPTPAPGAIVNQAAQPGAM